MPGRLKESSRLVHNLTTVGGSPVLFVLREVWHPPTDVYETEDAILVYVEIAGMDRDTLDVSLTGNELTVCGHRRNAAGGYNAIHRLEMHYGDFETTVTIPARVVESDIEAVYENGILCVRLPKERPHRIIVEASD
jgi:HSP20 family protein